ncbi:MAG: helix-turn-helix transcriptional regulator [Acidobacteria bacterium]|nr:helix-turn-helix transcriptional regulator [Acidobacteriota bacterium]
MSGAGAFRGLGRALRWLRERHGIRQYELARQAGVTKAMLSAYETGRQRPTLDSLEKLMAALGVDLAALAGALEIIDLSPTGEHRIPDARRSDPSVPLSSDGSKFKAALPGDLEPSPQERAALNALVEAHEQWLRVLRAEIRSSR